MITDKERAELKELTNQIRKLIQPMQWFDYGWGDCAEIIMRYVEKKNAESADQARKEAVCKIQSLDCVNDNSSEIRRQDAVNAILDDSTTDRIPDTCEKLHPEITNDYVKKLEDDLAIAVKALEEINERHSFADIVDDSYIISRDALREIQG